MRKPDTATPLTLCLWLLLFGLILSDLTGCETYKALDQGPAIKLINSQKYCATHTDGNCEPVK